MAVKKTYLKTWAVLGYYQYNIYRVDAGKDWWLEANPVTPGTVTRTAENETILRILLENDAKNATRFSQKV